MFSAVGSMLLLACAAIALLYAAQRAATVSTKPLTGLPYLSGWPPRQHALSRYHVRWYPATLLFLAFDVEMLFMYPWTVVVAHIGTSAVVEMFAFLGALLVAVAWAWREGAMRWV